MMPLVTCNDDRGSVSDQYKLHILKVSYICFGKCVFGPYVCLTHDPRPKVTYREIPSDLIIPLNIMKIYPWFVDLLLHTHTQKG